MEKCSNCLIKLANKKHVYAAEGELFCTKKCGVEWYAAHTKRYAPTAKENFEACAEKINVMEIGICKK